MPEKLLVEAIRDAHDVAMEGDETVVALGEDVGTEGGVFRATQGLQEKYGKERVIDTPLAETGIIGTAVGMALNGLKPIPEIQFVGFAYYACHQIQLHMSRFRSRSRGEFGLPMVLRSPYSGGIRALEHHEESPESIFSHFPGLKVVIPSSPYKAKGLLLASIADPDPVMFLEPARIYRSFREEVPDETYTIDLEQADVEKKGSDLTIITWGSYLRKFTPDAIKTIEEEHDASVELIDLQTINPFDMDTILNSVKKTGRAMIIQEAPRTCGFAAELAARIQEEALLHLEAPVGRVTSWDVPFPLFAREDFYLPDEKRIVAKAEELLAF